MNTANSDFSHSKVAKAFLIPNDIYKKGSYVNHLNIQCQITICKTKKVLIVNIISLNINNHVCEKLH